MVLEFEQFFAPTSSRYTDQWTGIQYLSLKALDEKLLALSGPNHEELWIHEDCLEHPEWTEIRRLAHEVILAFNWPTDEPPPSGAIYVSNT